MAANAALGSRSINAVAKRSTARVTTAVVTCAVCVRPPAAATTAVLVGLPLTTKVWENPARMFAAPRASRSRFSSRSSRCFWAKEREVAALCATMTRNIAADVASRPTACAQETRGRPHTGKPACTRPTVATPCCSSLKREVTMIARTTASSEPGTRGAKRSQATITMITPSVIQTVAQCSRGKARTVSSRWLTKP